MANPETNQKRVLK